MDYYLIVLFLASPAPSVEPGSPEKSGSAEVKKMTECRLCGQRKRQPDSTYCGWCEKITSDIMLDVKHEFSTWSPSSTQGLSGKES